MSLNVNQAYMQYYQIRLGTLSTKHQIQSNRVMLFSGKVMDTAKKINFYEQQKMLMMATPSGENIAIKAQYFDTPKGFDSSDPDTWGDETYYTTPCQKQLFIYRKADAGEIGNSDLTDSDGVEWMEIPYDHSAATSHEDFSYSDGRMSALQDSTVLSGGLQTGDYTFVYRNADEELETIRYEDLPFILQKEDDTAYQEMVEFLEAERYNLQETEKSIKSEMETTEVEIQAISSLMESTEKVLNKNTESFKWG